MARKKASKPDSEEKGEKKSGDKDKKLVVRIRERYKIMSEADSTNRQLALEDLRFANEPGAQWDANMKKERGDRPCYEFNKCRINGKKVINEIRANRPQGKVRAVEGGDKETAELYEGLCRNIANISDLDTVTDNAAEYQVDAGMGAWRIVTEYSDDSAFDQDILIKGIKNPFCLYADPACQDVMKRDAEDWILTERISKKAFDAKYPNAKPVNFEGTEFDDDEDWEDGENVRIVEYWYKEPYEKEIWLMPDGTAVDSTTDEAGALKKLGQEPQRKRVAKCHKVMMCIASGDSILEGPVEWAGSQFPFVMVYGEYKVIDGKAKWWGLHRFAKDAQRSYNVSRTAVDETIALAPKSKWWATQDQAKGLINQWSEAHKKNLPFMLYNPDQSSPGPPQMMPGAAVPVALIQQAVIAAQDIRDTTGLHEASFGEESDEKSGVALARKQSQAQVVTYNFPDNMAKGIRRTWEILIDLIPEIYDAERELRIIGSDGAEDYKRVNQVVQDPESGKAIRVNDLSVGKYDVAVTVGPNFSTLRQEAAEVYTQLAGQSPELMQVAGDLILKSFDYPYSEEMAKRFQAILPPPIQNMLAEGKELPPEAMAAMAKAEQAMAIVGQQSQLVQQAAAEATEQQASADKAKSEVQIALANLKTAEAQFEAKIAKVMGDIQAREQQMASKEQQVAGQQEQVDRAGSEVSEAQKAVQQIDKMVAEFMDAAADILAEIKSKPRLKALRIERAEGQPPRAIPEYEEATPA